MVEILRKPKGYAVTCDRCKSILMFQREDMFRNEQETETRKRQLRYISCPECGRMILVYDNHNEEWLNDTQVIYPDQEEEEV